jgi:hypothetical protein
MVLANLVKRLQQVCAREEAIASRALFDEKIANLPLTLAQM